MQFNIIYIIINFFKDLDGGILCATSVLHDWIRMSEGDPLLLCYSHIIQYNILVEY